MAEETQPPPEPAPAPAPAPAPVPAKASGAKKLVVPLILLVVVAAGGFGAWRFTSARAAKAAEEAAAQAAAQAEAAAKAKAKADAEAAAKAQAAAAAAAKAAADDPANIRKAIQDVYDQEAAAQMSRAEEIYEPSAFEAKFGRKKKLVVDKAKLAGLPTLTACTFSISNMTLEGDEARVVVQKHESYAVKGAKTGEKPIVKDTEIRTIWSRTSGAWKYARMDLDTSFETSETKAKKAAAARRAAEEAVAAACVNEIGILCNQARDDIRAAWKCLKENSNGLLAGCRDAVFPDGEFPP